MAKILITFGSTPLALRLKSLLSDTHECFFCSSEEIPSVLQKSISSIPSTKSNTFAHELLTKCLDLSIDFLIPIEYEEAKIINASKTLFNEYGIEVLIPAELHAIQKLEALDKSMQLDILVNGISLLGNQHTVSTQSGIFYKDADTLTPVLL